jgi:hypothetical protein
MKRNDTVGDWMPQSVQSVRCRLHVRQSILSQRAGREADHSPQTLPGLISEATPPLPHTLSGDNFAYYLHNELGKFRYFGQYSHMCGVNATVVT